MHTMAHAWVHRRPAFPSVHILSTAVLQPPAFLMSFQHVHSLETQGALGGRHAAMELTSARQHSIDAVKHELLPSWQNPWDEQLKEHTRQLQSWPDQPGRQ